MFSGGFYFVLGFVSLTCAYFDFVGLSLICVYCLVAFVYLLVVVFDFAFVDYGGCLWIFGVAYYVEFCGLGF